MVGEELTYTDTVENRTKYTYTVAAVNDTGEGTPSNTASATPGLRTVTVVGGIKKKAVTPVTVTWTGFGGTLVDVHRNGIVTSTDNDGTFTENWRGSGTVTYQVCETGSSTDCAGGSTVI